MSVETLRFQLIKDLDGFLSVMSCRTQAHHVPQHELVSLSFICLKVQVCLVVLKELPAFRDVSHSFIRINHGRVGDGIWSEALLDHFSEYFLSIQTVVSLRIGQNKGIKTVFGGLNPVFLLGFLV